MTNLQERSYQPELLDGTNIPFADIRQNMKELNTINTYLGGHAITIAGIKKILAAAGDVSSISICEIGCGGGDNLAAINKWCNSNALKVNFTGIDIKEECIEFARQQYPALDVKWIASDYSIVQFTNDMPDIIFSSLFCHHFVNDAVSGIIKWMKSNSTRGFFINDLHRHPVAYYSIKMITSVFSGSYLVKNDAPLSVARGFKKKEWQQIVRQSGIKGCNIQWKWAFRYLIVYIA